MKTRIITDEQALVSARFNHGTPIPVYDDGYGPLFIMRNSMGVQGIVRAQTWEDAYEICEDEFFPSPDGGPEKWEKEYGEQWHDDACWQDQYGFRPNSKNEPNGSYYEKDLNGEVLDILTPVLVEALGITLEIQSPPEMTNVPFYTLREMVESHGYREFISDKLGNDLFISDPERAARLHDYAENGSDGSTHAEFIEDWREYLGTFRAFDYCLDSPDCTNRLPVDVVDSISEEIDKCESRHESHGDLHSPIG